jgi:hypothetical protein
MHCCCHANDKGDLGEERPEATLSGPINCGVGRGRGLRISGGWVVEA